MARARPTPKGYAPKCVDAKENAWVLPYMRWNSAFVLARLLVAVGINVTPVTGTAASNVAALGIRVSGSALRSSRFGSWGTW